ncbi:endonuclease I [Pradoshia eiseniae]|uniref:Endonuclease I n=1 Tax=Pradoshia eiseniae TaxID=2064768 RepID=A0A2S7N0V8_9BACI|nr:endonuclease [Pradoshia eiseniae]PQD95722.1 endonuclease I [Pradoshia eiseniae]
MNPNQQAYNDILQRIRAMEKQLQADIAYFMQNLTKDAPIYAAQHKKLMPASLSDMFEQTTKTFKATARDTQDVYYDETPDNQLKTAYYQNISFDATNDELLGNIKHLVANTHKNQLPYSQSKKELHSRVDLHEDGKARSIYSGKSLERDYLIAQDLFYEAAVRKELTKYDTLRAVNAQTMTPLDSILAALSLNVEHVIPQSWFDKASPMVGDLHHLFTCEMNCNSFRSNIPYYDFEDYNPSAAKEMIRNDCGKRDGEERFEPQNGKGAVARATMYFLIRYPDKLPKERIRLIDMAMLYKWHQENPVTVYEKRRNWLIHQLQGNRNPFIDYPDTANILL